MPLSVLLKIRSTSSYTHKRAHTIRSIKTNIWHRKTVQRRETQNEQYIFEWRSIEREYSVCSERVVWCDCSFIFPFVFVCVYRPAVNNKLLLLVFAVQNITWRSMCEWHEWCVCVWECAKTLRGRLAFSFRFFMNFIYFSLQKKREFELVYDSVSSEIAHQCLGTTVNISIQRANW